MIRPIQIKFHQNLRGDPKFFVNLTWNDPRTYDNTLYTYIVLDQQLLHEVFCKIINSLGDLMEVEMRISSTAVHQVKHKDK